LNGWQEEMEKELRVMQSLVLEAEELSAKRERARILKAIEDAPPSMDFFGPHIAKENLYKIIQGEN